MKFHSDNQIGDEAADQLGEYISKLQNLKTLKLEFQYKNINNIIKLLQ
jgi:hypothetical protein